MIVAVSTFDYSAGRVGIRKVRPGDNDAPRRRR